jgi:thioredoxin reductase (NADPH)
MSEQPIHSQTAGQGETPDLYGAFPRLSDEQITTLAGFGHRRPTRRGLLLATAGMPSDMFYVVLRGQVAVIDESEAGRQVIRVHGPRRFLGELGLLEGQISFVTMEVRSPGSVLAVPVRRVREVIACDPVLSDLILRAYLIRRSLLAGQGVGFRIIGSAYSPDTRGLREFAARNRLPHRFVDLEKDPQAEQLLRRFEISAAETPIVIWRGGDVLRNPSNAELARLVGLPMPPPGQSVVDLLVVGAGPAGLAATVYGASDGLSTRLLDAIAVGGQAATSSRIENYLGFPAGISGAEFAERAVIQAEKFDAPLQIPAVAAALEADGGYYRVRLQDGGELAAKTVVIATGVRYRKLRLPRMRALESSCVFYAATQWEAQHCAGQPVAVVGGGNSAGQAALFLSRYSSQVHLVCRSRQLGEDMSRYLVHQIERNARISVLCDTEVCELLGDAELTSVVVRRNQTGEQWPIPTRMMFVFIGAEPCTSWLADAVHLDERGYVVSGRDMGQDAPTDSTWRALDRQPLTLETSMPGVFAAGDVRSGSVKRVTSAVGEGAMAVRMAVEHLAGAGSMR